MAFQTKISFPGHDSDGKIDPFSCAFYGTTAQRPAAPPIGHTYYDTDLGKAIWWSGTGWVTDMTANDATALTTHIADETAIHGVADTKNLRRSVRRRCTIAELNAGVEILPAIADRKYRVVDSYAVAYGGNVGATTSVDLKGTQAAAPAVLCAFLLAGLTRSAKLNMGAANATILADGASFTACDVNTAITAIKNGADLTTATGVDIAVAYVLEA